MNTLSPAVVGVMVILVWSVVLAQVRPGYGDPQLMSKPDVMIRVEKAPTGADYVRVQMLLEDYPQALLERQCRKIGELCGSEVRGLQISFTPLGVGPGGRELRILRADFATDYVINEETGVLRLLPFAKAFAGAPEPYVIDCLAVAFSGQTPKVGVTLATTENEAVKVESAYDRARQIVDYRITLKTQDADKIEFPERVGGLTKVAQVPSNGRVVEWLLVWVVGGAVLAGVLVYFALRPYGRHPSARTQRNLR